MVLMVFLDPLLKIRILCYPLRRSPTVLTLCIPLSLLLVCPAACAPSAFAGQSEVVLLRISLTPPKSGASSRISTFAAHPPRCRPLCRPEEEKRRHTPDAVCLKLLNDC